MKTQSPIYSFKFTISWIVIYIGIVFIMSRFLHLALSIYLGLWLLNLLVEVTERVFLKFDKRLLTVEK
jgi:hypothetical protein